MVGGRAITWRQVRVGRDSLQGNRHLLPRGVMLTAMTALTHHIVIDAPADTVSEAIADRFDRIG
jgi:hypothetical protein